MGFDLKKRREERAVCFLRLMITLRVGRWEVGLWLVGERSGLDVVTYNLGNCNSGLVGLDGSLCGFLALFCRSVIWGRG